MSCSCYQCEYKEELREVRLYYSHFSEQMEAIVESMKQTIESLGGKK